MILGGPVQYFDPNAFALQPAGTFGDSGRNSLRGPSPQNVDLSIIKNTRLSDRVDLQIRLEVTYVQRDQVTYLRCVQLLVAMHRHLEET